MTIAIAPSNSDWYAVRESFKSGICTVSSHVARLSRADSSCST